MQKRSKGRGLTRVKFHNRHQKLGSVGESDFCAWSRIHLKFLRRIETVNSHLYVQQLQRVHKYFVEKRPAFVNQKKILLHGNARPHTVRTKQQRKTKKLWN